MLENYKKLKKIKQKAYSQIAEMFENKWYSKYYTAKFMQYVTKAIIRDTLISLSKYIGKHKILERKWAQLFNSGDKKKRRGKRRRRRKRRGGKRREEERKENAKPNKVEGKKLYITQELSSRKQKDTENINKVTSYFFEKTKHLKKIKGKKA